MRRQVISLLIAGLLVVVAAGPSAWPVTAQSAACQLAPVFLMLRDRIGAKAFRAGLQAFWREHRLRTAGWQDLQQAFATQAGVDLSRFFEQWVRRPGAPLLDVAAARRSLSPAPRKTPTRSARSPPIAG